MMTNNFINKKYNRCVISLCRYFNRFYILYSVLSITDEIHDIVKNKFHTPDDKSILKYSRSSLYIDRMLYRKSTNKNVNLMQKTSSKFCCWFEKREIRDLISHMNCRLRSISHIACLYHY